MLKCGIIGSAADIVLKHLTTYLITCWWPEEPDNWRKSALHWGFCGKARVLGTVYTDPVSFVTASLSTRLSLSFTRRRSKPVLKPGRFVLVAKWGIIFRAEKTYCAAIYASLALRMGSGNDASCNVWWGTRGCCSVDLFVLRQTWIVFGILRKQLYPCLLRGCLAHTFSGSLIWMKYVMNFCEKNVPLYQYFLYGWFAVSCHEK